jgi:squalene cyclase
MSAYNGIGRKPEGLVKLMLLRYFTVPAVAGVLMLFAESTLARADVVMDDATKKATAKGLEWLAKRQNTDGSYSDGAYTHNTAITGFAMMAFMSQGHLPNQGLYGPEVTKAAKFLMAAQRPEDGYIIGSRGGNMYCHGMATLALSELWGQTGDDEIKPVLKKAVDLIIRSQNPQGGWRYEPAPTGADISVTIMQVMALRSAKNNGLHVPDITMKKAIAYIKSCYRPSVGGFTYQPHSGAPGFARTAAGCCVLFLSGEYTAKEIPLAVEYLKKHFDDHTHFYYGQYYAAHAMYQVGGQDWENWYGRLNKFFLNQQSADGSWAQTNRREVGPVYQTSIAVIALSAPAHYLPIFQR